MNPSIARARLLHFAALLCALSLLLGRWSPARFFGYGVFPPLHLDLRLYLTVLSIAALFVAGRAAITKDGLAVLCILFALGLYVLTVFAMAPVVGMNLKPYDYVEIKLVDVLILICLVWTFYFFAQQPTFEEHLWIWVLRIGLILTMIGGISALTSTITYDARLTVLGADGGNFFSRIVGVAAVLCAVHIGRGRPPTWVFATGLGVAAMVIVLSGSRGATISTAASVGLVLLLSPRRMLMLILLAALAVIGTIAVFSLPPEMTEFLHTRYVDQLVTTVYLARRDILYDQVVAFWHSSPVFGHGLGSFSLISGWDYPHNVFLEVLSEFGIVGAVLLFTPLLYLLVASATRWRYVDHRTLGAFVLFFIAAQVSGDIFDSRMVFLLPILMAVGSLARYEEDHTVSVTAAAPWSAREAPSF
jgi:O-antigen ligase